MSLPFRGEMFSGLLVSAFDETNAVCLGCQIKACRGILRVSGDAPRARCVFQYGGLTTARVGM